VNEQTNSTKSTGICLITFFKNKQTRKMRITSMNSQQDKRMAVNDVFHGPRTYL